MVLHLVSVTFATIVSSADIYSCPFFIIRLKAVRILRIVQNIDILLPFQILELAVIATLITAPVGAFGISLFGPKLLSHRSNFDPMNVQENEGFQNDEESSEPSASANGQRTLSADHSV